MVTQPGDSDPPAQAGREQPCVTPVTVPRSCRAEALPASLEWKGEVLPLEPVDELSVLTVCDNVMDILLPDEGPGEAAPAGRDGPAGTDAEGPDDTGGKAADVPLAQHGFSALVEIRKGGRVRPAAVRHRDHARRVRRQPAPPG